MAKRGIGSSETTLEMKHVAGEGAAPTHRAGAPASDGERVFDAACFGEVANLLADDPRVARRISPRTLERVEQACSPLHDPRGLRRCVDGIVPFVRPIADASNEAVAGRRATPW